MPFHLIRIGNLGFFKDEKKRKMSDAINHKLLTSSEELIKAGFDQCSLVIAEMKIG